MHWITVPDRRMSEFFSVKGLEIALVPGVMLVFSTVLPDYELATFLFAGVSGLVTCLAGGSRTRWYTCPRC